MERNHCIFQESHLGCSYLWRKIVSRLLETIFANCDLSDAVDSSDLDVSKNLLLVDNGLVHPATRRQRWAKKKIHREGRWIPPPEGVLKVNMDGSSRGNPGHARIG